MKASLSTLAGIPLLATIVSASRAPAPPDACGGCTATLVPATGIHRVPCPGTDWWVETEVAASNGTCLTDHGTGDCKGASCTFTVTMRWKTPAGAPIDFCHSYGGNTYCAPTEVGTGLPESTEHSSSQMCNDDVAHLLRNRVHTLRPDPARCRQPARSVRREASSELRPARLVPGVSE